MRLDHTLTELPLVILVQRYERIRVRNFAQIRGSLTFDEYSTLHARLPSLSIGLMSMCCKLGTNDALTFSVRRRQLMHEERMVVTALTPPNLAYITIAIVDERIRSRVDDLRNNDNQS